MPRRSGLLILLQVRMTKQGARAEDNDFAGIGEVCPLPMFHQETLGEAEKQLNSVLEAWRRNQPLLPLTLLHLDGTMSEWLEQNCPHGDRLLPSVRSGLEMAVLHVLCRAAGASNIGVQAAKAHGLRCHSDLGVNALLTRQEDLQGSSEGAAVVKVKVGRDPQEDASRVNSLSEVLSSQKGSMARLRLDANQGWTMDEAIAFVSNLSDASVAITEYLEEPVRWTVNDPVSFLKSWEDLADKTGRRVRFAVDESLTDTDLSLEHLAESKAPIAAIVLKPALQGMEQMFKCGVWALQHGVQPVVSSAFESGVALCHFSILAASMTPQPGFQKNQVSACHGLGTFTRLAEDVLDPPFADLIYHHDNFGWRVDILRCQEALNRTVDALVASRDPPPKNNAWC